MRKEMFAKMVSVFKLQGSAAMRMRSAEMIEVEFYCEKSPFFCVHLEAACREIWILKTKFIKKVLSHAL